MKIYTKVPRDLTRVKEKIIFNMTKRQLVCFGMAALIGFPAYFYLKNRAGATTASLCMVFLMIPMFLLAMYDKNGQPLEVLIMQMIRTKYLRCKKRPYKLEKNYQSEKNKCLNEKKSLDKRIKEFLQKDSPKTAQQTIPYQKMYMDGICKVSDNYFSKTIQFYDRNYQLLDEKEKRLFLETWGDFIKLFGNSVQFEFSFMSLPEDKEQIEKKLRFSPQYDGLNYLREEVSSMIKKHRKDGNKELEGIKLLTFGLECNSLKEAKVKLEHIEKEVLEQFRMMKVRAESLDGTKRLRYMHRMLNIGNSRQCLFSWKRLFENELETKDFIAPASFEFSNGKRYKVEEVYEAVSYLSVEASDMSDEMLKQLMDTGASQMIAMHVQTLDKASAIRMVKRTITEIDSSKIDEQKKAVKSGYDMDIIPTDLSTYGKDARWLLNALQSEDEMLHLVTILIVHTGKTKEELEEHISRTARIVQQNDCRLCRLDNQQEQGFMSSLPLAFNQVAIKRALTTSSTSILVPFVAEEIFHENGAAIYYGVDQVTKKLIIADRKRLKAPNGLIVGSSGSGKSYKAKEEMTSVLLATDDDVIVCDPEAEYRPLVEKLSGQVIRICATSHDYINPLDIHMNYSEEDNPLALKAEFIMSLFELILGGSDRLEAEERSIIDRCIPAIYKKYFSEPIPENMPILEDLYNEILDQKEEKAKRLATTLELYVKGSLRVFNHRTNVNLKNRLVCFDIKDLGNQLKKVGMLIIQDHVWGRVTANRSVGKSTWYYTDEFHLLLKEKQTASYAVEIWKRFRKHGGICTAITQDIKDLLKSYEIENIIENSDFVIMFNQGSGDKDILAERLQISPEQLKYVTGAREGTGLLSYGGVILPFEDNYPKDSELYKVMTTKLNEIVPLE